MTFVKITTFEWLHKIVFIRTDANFAFHSVLVLRNRIWHEPVSNVNISMRSPLSNGVTIDSVFPKEFHLSFSFAKVDFGRKHSVLAGAVKGITASVGRKDTGCYCPFFEKLRIPLTLHKLAIRWSYSSLK